MSGLIEAHGLQQHVKVPTHIRGHTLDVVITRDSLSLPELIISDTGIGDRQGNSICDHFAVSFNIHIAKPPPQHKQITYRKLRDIDMSSFISDISNHPDLQNLDADLEDLVDTYNTTLQSVLDKHAPLCTKSIIVRPHAPWFSEEIREAKQDRRKRERLYRRTELTVHLDAFRQQCKVVNVLIASAKETYYSAKISECKGDAKQLFKLTKGLLGEQGDNKLPAHSSQLDLADKFNDFFIAKIATIREAITSTVSAPGAYTPPETFTGERLENFELTTPEEIHRLISRLPSKSCPLDPMPTGLLKQCSQQLSPVISNIINKSLSVSSVPASLKKAVVRPLLKKNDLDLNLLKNYRPVSNLPTLEKLLEKVVSGRLEDHLHSQSLHDKCQSAYRKYHSTETALLKVQADIMDALDKGSNAVLITLDLSAAFDTIDHDILLNRLHELFGISGEALKWLTSYFQGRAQSVIIGSSVSQEKALTCGVPQGSVLGPKCYCMYTKPVGSIIAHHNYCHHAYADDTDLYLVIRPNVPWADTKPSLEACLADIQVWMTSNMLKLNQEKTELIIFTPKNHPQAVSLRTIHVGDCTVCESDCIKSLGVLLDKHLTMEKQINATARSCYFNIRNIGRIRRYIDSDSCKTLVQALITSRLDYANALYIGVPKSVLNRLQQVQNTAARLVTRSPRRNHITPVLKDLHWLPVEFRIQYKLILYTYKALHDIAPEYLKDMITPYSPTRSLRSQSQLLLEVPKVRTVSYGERCFSVATAKLWNSLPVCLKSESKLVAFKRGLKTYFFKMAYELN